MGPVQRDDESLASYRFRYVRYCCKWLFVTVLGTAAFALCAQLLPIPQGLAIVVGLVAVFAIGMPAVAALGFFIGAMYARRHGTAIARAWQGIVTVLGSALMLASLLFFCVQLVLVAQEGEIWSFQRRGGRWLAWASDPMAYSLSAFGYAACLVGMLAWLASRLHRCLAAPHHDHRARRRG
jgi:hypothetical protein